MVIDYLFRVVHAAITDLDGVSVEDFSELVIFGKALRNLILLYTIVYQILKITSVSLLLSRTVIAKLSKVLTILTKKHPVTWFDSARHFSQFFRSTMDFDAGRYAIYLHSLSVTGSTFLKPS